MAAYLARVERRTDGYEALATTFGPTHLVYFDSALADIARRDARLSRHACSQLRSAAFDTALRAFISKSEALADPPGSGLVDLGLAMTDDVGNILFDGVVQRLHPKSRERLATIDLFLPYELIVDFDARLHQFAITYLDPIDQPAYLGAEYNDLRSAFIEAVTLGWLLDEALVARYAVPACETLTKLESQERVSRRRRLLRRA